MNSPIYFYYIGRERRAPGDRAQWLRDGWRRGMAWALLFATIYSGPIAVRAAATAPNGTSNAPAPLTVLPASGADATKTSVGERQFDTPEAAVEALRAAAKSGDRAALRAIFDPKGEVMVSGDKVQDANDRAAFAKAVTQFCRLSYDDDDRVTLNIGAEDWPFPIPLVHQDGKWFFDTAAGKDEIINRRIGQNELIAIEVCQNFVDAEREYASDFRDGSGVLKYAQSLKSSPGARDGLYWEPGPGEAPSPFGPLVASARAEGYKARGPSDPPAPFHGYLFRILTAQGPHAPGGAYNYIINGNMIAGFALVAAPVRWSDSGVMTFIVNQQGKVYEKNLGSDSLTVAGSMSAFDPDDSWKPVTP